MQINFTKKIYKYLFLETNMAWGKTKKQKSGKIRDDYLNKFDDLVYKSKEHSEHESNEEAIRRKAIREQWREEDRQRLYNEKKKSWISKMNLYRQTREQLKGNLFYRGNPKIKGLAKYSKETLRGIQDEKERTNMEVQMKAEADDLMNRNSLDGVKLAMEFYKELGVAGKHSVQNKLVKFVGRTYRNYTPDQLSALRPYLNGSSEKSLERKTFTFFGGILGVVASLFFLSPIVTGNAIGNLVLKDSSIIGAVFFIVGILFLFVSFKNK